MSATSVLAQPKTYSFEELDSLQRIEQRPVVVFLHADWCTICQAMELATWQDDQVMELLEEQFYFIEFDGESERSVDFQGHTFEYLPTGSNTGIHELAQALGTFEGKVAFPTTVILNREYAIIFQYNAYLGIEEMQAVLEEARSR